MSKTSIQVGTRFRLTSPVDRFPDFLAQVGMTGRIVVNQGIISGKMDQPIQGAEQWGNEIYWDTEEGFLRDTQGCKEGL